MRLAPRLDHRGQRSPRPVSFQSLTPFRPGPRRRYRIRRCLLKGCEQAFVPSRPQSRYCRGECARAACQWRRWRASRRYRASVEGRERRRAQHGRYRQRRRERASTAIQTTETVAAAIRAAEAVHDAPASETPEATLKTSPESREGQRPAEFREHFAERACLRPGCYLVFGVRHEHSNRHFCSVACRLALRRVLDREARYHWRRQRESFRRVTGRYPSPDTS